MKRTAAIWLIAALVGAAAPIPLLAGPIHDAAQKGDIPAIKALLAQGTDINAKDEQGGTALLYATIRSQKATVEFLLNNGAKTEIATGEGATALHLAARYGEADIASLLVARGAKVDVPLPGGITPLSLAARYGSLDIVRLLVEHGANLNSSETEGYTPLIYAAALGNGPIVDYLLSKGANANAVTKGPHPPRTALGLAAWNRHQDDAKYKPIIRALLAHGAKDVWLSGVPGFDPEQVSGLLLSQGADGTIMVGSVPFILALHSAVRPWRDPGTPGKSDHGNNFFVWDTPPRGDKSVTLVLIEDQAGNKTSGVAVLPAFVGEGGVVYNEGVSTIGKDGPFAELAITWQDANKRPISGGHIRITRKSETVDLTTDQQGNATHLFGHITINEPMTVAFISDNGTSKNTELDCVLRGASQASVEFIIQKTN